MSDANETSEGGSKATSWRDVYTLVEGVEKRLTARMDDIAAAAVKRGDDHEVRIRVLEKTSNTQVAQHETGMTFASGAQRFAILLSSLAALIVSFAALVTR